MNKLFVVGDLHGGVEGELSFLDKKHFPEQSELTKEDIVFQLGDFGLVWYYPECMDKYKKDFHKANELADKNFTTFVIPGNHENYDLINSLPLIEKFGGMVYELKLRKNSIFFAKRGEIYTINDKKIFTFSGATSAFEHNRFTREQFENGELVRKKKYKYGQLVGTVKEKVKLSEINLWKQESSTKEEKEFALNNLAKYQNKVDLILTHTGPVEVLEEMIHKTPFTIEKFECKEASFLSEINNLVEFNEWHFGHLHVNRKVVDNLGFKFECHYLTKPMEILL